MTTGAYTASFSDNNIDANLFINYKKPLQTFSIITGIDTGSNKNYTKDSYVDYSLELFNKNTYDILNLNITFYLVNNNKEKIDEKTVYTGFFKSSCFSENYFDEETKLCKDNNNKYFKPYSLIVNDTFYLNSSLETGTYKVIAFINIGNEKTLTLEDSFIVSLGFWAKFGLILLGILLFSVIIYLVLKLRKKA